MSDRKDTPRGKSPASPISSPQSHCPVTFQDQASQQWSSEQEPQMRFTQLPPSNRSAQLRRTRAELSLSNIGQQSTGATPSQQPSLPFLPGTRSRLLPSPFAPHPSAPPEPTKRSGLEGGRSRDEEKYEPPADIPVTISEEFVDDSSSDDIQFGVKQ
ncbi:hypothetical protein FQN49_004787, partial [Arthroderma sp. PD_2]